MTRDLIITPIGKGNCCFLEMTPTMRSPLPQPIFFSYMQVYVLSILEAL
jgi:hypothetical protein